MGRKLSTVSIGATVLTAPAGFISAVTTGYGLPWGLIPVGSAVVAIVSTCSRRGSRQDTPFRLPAHVDVPELVDVDQLPARRPMLAIESRRDVA